VRSAARQFAAASGLLEGPIAPDGLAHVRRTGMTRWEIFSLAIRMLAIMTESDIPASPFDRIANTAGERS